MADTTQKMRQQEYELSLLVNRLRRQLQESANPSDLAANFQELGQAEQDLAEVQQKLADEIQQNNQGGLILDTKKETALLGADTTGLNVEIRLRMEHLPTSIYHLFNRDEHPLVSCEVHNTKNDQTKRIRITAFIDGYSAPAVESFELKPKKSHKFDLLPTLFPRDVQQINELTRATLNILVEDLDGNVELHKTEPIWLLARNTAPLSIKDPKTGEWKDVTCYFGAFVTPNQPAVMSFLRKVAVHHTNGRLEGYHRIAEEPQAVELQIRAIFDALKADAGLTYVDSILTNNPDEGASSQRVRLPRQSLAGGTANCIDGTVLFASLIEAISMNPAIVVVPGHILLAWQKTPTAEEWEYLETTKIGSNTFEEACQFGKTWAEGYQKRRESTGDERYFRRWSVRELRTIHRITPME